MRKTQWTKGTRVVRTSSGDRGTIVRVTSEYLMIYFDVKLSDEGAVIDTIDDAFVHPDDIHLTYKRIYR